MYSPHLVNQTLNFYRSYIAKNEPLFNFCVFLVVLRHATFPW